MKPIAYRAPIQIAFLYELPDSNAVDYSSEALGLEEIETEV